MTYKDVSLLINAAINIVIKSIVEWGVKLYSLTMQNGIASVIVLLQLLMYEGAHLLMCLKGATTTFVVSRWDHRRHVGYCADAAGYSSRKTNFRTVQNVRRHIWRSRGGIQQHPVIMRACFQTHRRVATWAGCAAVVWNGCRHWVTDSRCRCSILQHLNRVHAVFRRRIRLLTYLHNLFIVWTTNTTAS